MRIDTPRGGSASVRSRLMVKLTDEVLVHF
jgi:hypothetical protein